jgi:HEPN domain-containing protein
MNVRPEVLEVLRQWVRKAEHDLEAVRRILAQQDGCPYDTACFHCQQAVEKYLKALLTLLGIHAARTHDLQKLIGELPPTMQAEFPVAAVIALNPYAVDVRYADDWHEPGGSEAATALQTAETIRAEVRRLLPAEALD